MLRSLAPTAFSLLAGLAFLAAPTSAKAQYAPPVVGGFSIATPNFSLGVGNYPVYSAPVVPAPVYVAPVYRQPVYYPPRPIGPVSPYWNSNYGYNHYHHHHHGYGPYVRPRW